MQYPDSASSIATIHIEAFEKLRFACGKCGCRKCSSTQWAVVRLARDLDRGGIPFLLTVQVDSVGLSDKVIPANVKSSANQMEIDPAVWAQVQQLILDSRRLR